MPLVGQPAFAGCAQYANHFTPGSPASAVKPGAMQDSIRLGGSLLDTILVNIGCS